MRKISLIEELSYSSFFRISVALLALSQVLSYNEEFNAVFSGSIISHDLMSAGLGRTGGILENTLKLLENKIGIDKAFFFIKYLYLISLTTLLIGYKTRFSAIIAFITNHYIFFSQELFTYGYDGFLDNSLLFCCVFKTNYNTSLDSFIRNKWQAVGVVETEGQIMKYALRVTLCVVYLFSGLSKAFDGTGWWNGNKMVASLHFNSSKTSLATIDFLINHPYLLVIGGISTVLIEVLYPILIFPKITRNITLYGVILMHLLIAFLLKLPAFSAIMIIWNLAAFQYFTESINITSEAEKLPVGIQRA